MAKPPEPDMVYIIDDEPSVQRALMRLMRSAGMSGNAFSSVKAFMAADIDAQRACVVADVHLPGGDTMALPELLKRHGKSLPVIYITARDSDRTRECARRAGGAGYFLKPVDDQALIDAIHWAIGERLN